MKKDYIKKGKVIVMKTMKKMMGIVTAGAVAATMALPATAAENVFNVFCSQRTGDDVWASLNADGVMTVSGTGNMDTYGMFEENPDYPWTKDETANLVEHIVIEEGVTYFDFVWSFPELKTIRLPDSVAMLDFWEFTYLSNVQDKVFMSPYTDLMGKDSTLGEMPKEELEQLLEGHDNPFGKYSCTFYGYKDTVWENMSDYGMKFHAMGDMDSDSDVNISDAASILELYAKSAAGLEVNTEEGIDIDAADISRDGIIGIDDATVVLKCYANSIAGLSTDWEAILQK